MDAGSPAGGIRKLRELIEEHPAEFAYDFRSRFQLGIDDIGTKISLLEAVYLVAILLRDPTSWLQAADNEWTHPASYEWQVLAHVYDSITGAHYKKPKPYPTPWPTADKNRIGSGKLLPRETVEQRLSQMNPKEKRGS